MRTPAVPLSRREFLKRAMAAGAVATMPGVLSSRLFGATAPSNQIAVGVIGTGNIAQGHIDTLLGFPEVRIAALCDVDRVRLEATAAKVNAFYGDNGCRMFGDFRELAARADLDAVWVCTPDNWHALNAIEAIRQGKDVYVEKPLTLTIREGRELVNAARKHGRVIQTGTQQRSTRRFHDAAEFIRNGGLGRLERIEVLIPANNKFTGATWEPEPVPAGLDWDLWLGPAPWTPFNRQGCHYNFRFILDYAAGQVTNWGAHYIDIAQWALGMDDSGPVEIEGQGEFPTSGLFTTATKVDFTCRYANGVPLRCRTRYDGVFDGNVRFFGERGWIDVSRSTSTASDPALLKAAAAREGAIKLPTSDNHHDNFLQCLRSRARPISDVETGHRGTTVCNLGNIAMLLGRKLRWDPAREAFIDDLVANRMCARSMRGPWGLGI
ncbi:Gfo/Idh/MocA family protein [Opitutus terrae]|uniref:Oxidoreductase domain protein n=1 Tax=Opitutus terrae (strain DSM 11246 / JCM 15787 / PB90-1) TaxID=452637 RepID=B1ZVB9_OPITP|nr:Gfo/Idh/MocA family oxidoreductase [Opitutus terrae]ACB76786.1 oxidoreductase domain protein [Opitutus terrae PB90-1]